MLILASHSPTFVCLASIFLGRCFSCIKHNFEVGGSHRVYREHASVSICILSKRNSVVENWKQTFNSSSRPIKFGNFITENIELFYNVYRRGILNVDDTIA